MHEMVTTLSPVAQGTGNMKENAQIIEYPAEKLYTIGTVSKLTGVGAITLRAWERRYGLIQPVRKESGHRLYSREHIDQINRITSLTQKGMRISQIRPEMLESDSAAESEDGTDSDSWNEYLNSMVAAIISFDEERLEEIYNKALSLYPIGLVTRKLLTPLLIELGLRWESQQGSIAEEHFFAFYLRNKLGARFHHRTRGSSGPLILLAGLPGEYHEIGLLIFALAAHEAGYSLLTLGANMPLNELLAVARKRHCRAIVLSGAIEPSRQLLAEELPALVNESSIPVLIGGLSSVYACDSINNAGAESMGRDIDHGLQRLAEILSNSSN
jgi:DNA-binding transcriptional MerR regulator/methylmalonyl-CoA mutase cobalamin-binding subunit